jgi:lipopolysaccharide transport system ATP-binding protein
MSDIAIRVENLSKAYRIGQEEQRHETLLGAMASIIRAPLRNFRNLRKLTNFKELPSPNNPQQTTNNSPPDILWALKDVSFEVKHGEVLGIIGRNGAGKSTLLKILSRITEPTSGRALVYGRVGSLLEVGTGFHPDLTGRENIYLNGTILGMKKREVDARFDEIVDFSGVEKFIDTPVKRYSSGMRVRLAFAVAAHLEPEVLIVDEVLAVGDAEFQVRCIGKISEVANCGRTVLFVSHNLGSVMAICKTAIIIDSGSARIQGNVEDVIRKYRTQLQESATEVPGYFKNAVKQCNTSEMDIGFIDYYVVRNHMGIQGQSIGLFESLSVILYVSIALSIDKFIVGVLIENSDQVALVNLRSDSEGRYFGPSNKGDFIKIKVVIPNVPFFPGRYYLSPWIASIGGKRCGQLRNRGFFDVDNTTVHDLQRQIQPGKGLIAMRPEWHLEPA